MTALRSENGFTMIETLVAFMMLVIGVLASLSLLDTGRRTSFRAEESQAINDIGQRELEKVRALDFDQVALTQMPATSEDANNPGHRVSASETENTFDLQSGGGDDPQGDLVYNGSPRDEGGVVAGGQISPSSRFENGDLAGDIYRYVVWRDDPQCLLGELEICVPGGGEQDYKRVIVAVRVDQTPVSGFARAYQEFQTDVIDPEASTLTSGGGGGGNTTTAQQFWLTDVPCQETGEPEPAVPTESATNDTVGKCNSSSGKPDALITQAPFYSEPVPDPVDYSNDIEPENPDADKGLQLLSQTSAGCTADPSATDKHKRIHWWSTRRLRVGSTGPFVMSGQSTLELWTRTIDDAAATGAFCIYLRRRSLASEVDATGLIGPTPIPIVSASSPTAGLSCSPYSGGAGGIVRCTTSDWPRDSWQKIRVRMNVSTLSLSLDSRLELGLSVDQNGTSANVFQFLYDHPTYDSRWEVVTTTPL